ncbi:ATP-dependent DNA helicase PIF3 [Frankliniella fusca]|uniref:ATP-dependent DNA helicase PIF3 n=1 Tax=Frankliniella fusca TaxID=407009 RepID=A0AAE1LJ70_9NEOP|nr:ATP-dependent DNA helicase PIF3 [Frankliniella fusca]
MFWVNPFRFIWRYLEQTGNRRDLPILKRMMVETPYLPIGTFVMLGSMAGSYIYLYHIFVPGVGLQKKFTVMRSDDPRIPLYRDDVINAEKYYSKK